MVPPLMAWFAAFATGTAVWVAMTPRLPVYKLTIHQMPLLQRIDNQWKTKLPTRIEFHNDNFVHIDVHAIAFDLYYSADAQNGHLQHIAHVHDKNQLPSTRQQQKSATTATTTTTTTTPKDKQQQQLHNSNHKKNAKTNNHNAPLWSIGSRSYFVTHDDMYVKLFPSSTARSSTSSAPGGDRMDWKRVLASLRILLSHWWWNGNARHVIVPATGVAHIKAAATGATSTTSTVTSSTTTTPSTAMAAAIMAYASPALTISMVCDNLIDTWTMQVQGVDCVLHQLVPGWVPWEQAVDKMRLYALTKLTARAETGGVLGSKDTATSTDQTTINSSWKDLVHSDAWQDAMLAL